MSSRRFLVIFGNGELKKKGERLKAVNGSASTEVPVRYLEAVVCVGAVSITSQVVNLLMLNSVPLYFMTRFGSPKGFLLPQVFSSANRLRLSQYEAYKRKRLKVAKKVVLLKIEAVERFYKMDLKDQKERLDRTEFLEEVMGVEGEVSKVMFGAFKQNIKDCGLEFQGRVYRPPADPVNALLSLAYTFVHFLALPVVITLGYDPFISFLHTKRGSHASFCSDAMEPLRPLLTKKLEEPLILKRFSGGDFQRSGKGYFLKKESYSKFVNWFEGLKEEVLLELRESLLKIGEAIS